MMLTAKSILETGPVIPVLAIENLDDAVPLARALVAGGVKVLEITLRTDIALKAIEAISNEVEDAIVGVGTVTSPHDLHDAYTVGAKFAISPGLTPTLAHAANAMSDQIPLIPGISTASELMFANEVGFHTLKFFPAEASGGTPMLKSLSGPFPHVTFCPTGGISPQNAPQYLALPNVSCVGGSWLAPANLIRQKDWAAITYIAATASRLPSNIDAS